MEPIKPDKVLRVPTYTQPPIQPLPIDEVLDEVCRALFEVTRS